MDHSLLQMEMEAHGLMMMVMMMTTVLSAFVDCHLESPLMVVVHYAQAIIAFSCWTLRVLSCPSQETAPRLSFHFLILQATNPYPLS
jgi:hypothetical protein